MFCFPFEKLFQRNESVQHDLPERERKEEEREKGTRTNETQSNFKEAIFNVGHKCCQ